MADTQNYLHPHNILFLLLISFVGSINAASILEIQDVEVNNSNASGSTSINISEGGSFTFYLDVENNGPDDSPADYNGVSVSFPSFTSSSYKSNVLLLSSSSDLNYGEYYGNEALGGDAYANYVMVEVVDNNGWDGTDGLSAENNNFKLTIWPKSSDFSNGYFDIYYRTAASDIESWVPQDWTYVPSSGSTGPLGFKNYSLRVYLITPQVV